MLSKQKQKALIEAMLFVSTIPVPVNKIVSKLRQAERIAKKMQSGEQVEVQQEEDILSGADVDDAIPELLVQNMNIEHLLIEGAENLSNENEQVDVQLVAESEIEFIDEEDAIEIRHDELAQAIDQLADDGAAGNDNERVAQEEDDDDGDSDIMQQLMQKQQELEQEISANDVKELLSEIEADFAREERGLELVLIAKGYQIRTKYEISLYLKDEKVKVPQRFSPSSLETLAIVAYQQPITRQRVEEIRGVDSGGVMKTLLDKQILRVVGRSDEPGKPLIYGTSRRFLEIFGLSSLRDLPNLQDFHALQTSQDRQIRDDQDQEIAVSDPNEIRIDDLIETAYEEMDLADQQVLNDLDESLSELKRVEKDVIASSQPETQNENEVDSLLAASTTPSELSVEQTSGS